MGRESLVHEGGGVTTHLSDGDVKVLVTLFLEARVERGPVLVADALPMPVEVRGAAFQRRCQVEGCEVATTAHPGLTPHLVR